ncbi:hypothetical protein MSL71_17040 [Desulfoluna butyratoxydans]|uniref:Uncharacterized protein n=1 Tax=Desulfoluna butyratoxydans TaxID=231438 RepID=A0A4U8YKK0_9BACT|nr:hypothetical protein MSL71_17040 [Desulfoluna butyratoxydans]
MLFRLRSSGSSHSLTGFARVDYDFRDFIKIMSHPRFVLIASKGDQTKRGCILTVFCGAFFKKATRRRQIESYPFASFARYFVMCVNESFTTLSPALTFTFKV